MKKLAEVAPIIPAVECYIVHDNKVLMHKRAEDKKKFPGYWIGPGGHIDQGEDPLTAAIREVKEETNVSVKPKDIQLKVVAFHHHLDRNEVWAEYLFRATIPSNQHIVDTHEGTSDWIEIKKLKSMKNIFPPSQIYLEHILDHHSGILYSYADFKAAKLIKFHKKHIDRNG